VGALSYFAKRSLPKRPQDLIGRNCINLRLPTYGGLYSWEFQKAKRELKVHVEGQLVFNGTLQMLNAALADSASRMCRRTWCRRISPRGASIGCLEIGVSRFRDTTSSTQAGVSPHRRWPCWSTRFATGARAKRVATFTNFHQVVTKMTALSNRQILEL
jgi:hypothetical protein